MTPALFAQSLLASLSLPVADNNVAALVAIQAQEGGHEVNSAWFNPLNTMYPTTADPVRFPGAHQAPGKIMKGIKAYGSWDEGIRATAATLAQSNMRAIFSSLARSAPPRETLEAFGHSPWGWYKVVDGRRVYQPYKAALELLASPAAALASYANKKYRGGGSTSSWWPTTLSLGGGLPAWSGVLLCASTAILGSQLLRRRPALGGAIGAGVGLFGFHMIGNASRQTIA